MIAARITRAAVAALVVLGAVLTAGTRAEEPSSQAAVPAAPEKFGGMLMGVNGPARGMVSFRVTVERWSTPEERKALAEALRSKGTDGLVAALDKLNMGRIQFDNNLANPIRLASSWKTEKGLVVRLATNRRISFEEDAAMARSADYPFGVVEFLLPPEGPGEGTLLGAVKVQFNEQGQIEVQSMPQNTGAQRLSEIEREVPKQKKEKKKS